MNEKTNQLSFDYDRLLAVLIRFKHLSVGVIFTKASLMSDLNGSLKQILS